MIKKFLTKIAVIMLIGFIGVSVFAGSINGVTTKETNTKDQYIIRLESEEIPYTPTTSSNPEMQFAPSSSPIKKENLEDKKQTYSIDIEKMKNEHIQQLDKNADQITDSLEKKIDQKSSEENQTVSIIITTKTIMFKDDMSLFEGLGGIIRHVWDDPADATYGFSGEIDASKVRRFSTQVRSNVELIEENLPAMRNSDVSTHLMMVRTHVWDNLNYTGNSNMSVAVLDTGIDDSHTAFSPGYEDLNWTRKIVGWYDATTDSSTSPEDYIGHGSHVAGIVAANAYNDSYDDGRIVSTWSYSYDVVGGYLYVFSYVIWVNKTGTIDISYVWRGKATVKGTDLTLYAPNGTEIASNTTGSSNMTVNYTLSTEEDFGYWKVSLGVYGGASGGIVDFAGVNKYPYPDPTDNYSRFSGVAPDVKLVGVKIFDNTGAGWASDVIEAFNWVKNNKATYHIAIASGSFSFDGTVTAVDLAAAALVNSGVTVVLSAGNDGQGTNSIYSPGQVDGVITVAASDDYDNITTYSSEGPGETSNTTKPDISAPGGEWSQGAILQVDSNDVDSKSNDWTDKYPNDFTNIQGTSMSCPFVSGSLALLIQAMRGYDYWKDGYGSATNPFKVKQLILMTANEIYSDDRGGKDPVEGYGRLNIYAAIEAIENTYGVGTLANGTLSSELGKRKVWAQNVTLTTGTNYTFGIAVPNGADFDLFLYEPDPNQFGEPVLAANSTNVDPGTNENIAYVPETSGTYYLVVKSSFSNTGSGTFNLTSTSTPIGPILNIDSPMNTTYPTNIVTVTLSGDAVHTWYYIENVDSSNITWTMNVERTLADGTYILHAYGNDTSGYETHKSVTFTIDTTLPVVTINSPINNTYSFSLISIYASNLSAVHTAWYRYKNGSWSANYSMSYNPGESRWEREGLYWLDGSYLVQVFFNDSVGNEASNQEWFSVDTTAPVVTITSPTNTTYTTSIVNIHATNTTDVAKAWYRFRNGSWSANYSMSFDSGETRWEVQGLSWIDGNYLIQVFFNDSVGNEAYSEEWFAVDTTAPVVTITSPANTTYTSTTISIHATNTTDVDKAWYRYKNSSWSANYSMSFDLGEPRWEAEGLTWNDGNYHVQVFFNDTVGNEAFSEEWFTVDTIAPLVTIISPTNTTYTTNDVAIYASNSTDVDTAWYRFRNGSWSTNHSMTYDPVDTQWEVEELTWTDGSYHIQVFFNDSVGNEASSQEWFSVDTTPPVVTVISPANSTYTTPDVPVYATNSTLVHTAWYRYKNGSWSANYSMSYAPGEPRWEGEGLTWNDGNYLIQVFFNDTVGNKAYNQEWFTVDTTAPAVTITSPTNTTYTTPEVAVYAMNSTLVHTAWYRYKNSSWSANYSLSYAHGEPRWEKEGLFWLDGNYLIQVYFNDSVGNEAYSEEWFTVDTIAPVVTITSPTNTTYTALGVAVYAINSTPVHTAWYRYENGSWSANYSMSYAPGEPRWEREGLTWTDGNYQVQVFFNDSVGNEAYDEEWFSVDTTAPAVTITSPTNTTYTTPTVNIHATNPTDVDNAWYRYQNSTWSANHSMTYDPVDTQWEVEGLTWTDGNYLIQVFFNDSVGNEAFSEEWFSVDTTAPVVTITSPTNTTYSTSDVAVYATNSTLVHTAWYRYKNGSWSANYSMSFDPGEPRWEREGLTWTDGNYLIQVFFNDSVGNEAFSEEWFSVDTTAPAVTITSPTNTTYSTPEVAVYATNSTLVHTAWYRYKNGSWSANYSMSYDSDVERWEAEGLTWMDGNYQVQVFFNDTIGNEAYSEEWFSVDTIAPVVTITSPTNTTYTTTAINIHASNITDVDEAWYRFNNVSWSVNYSMTYDPSDTQWEAEDFTWTDGNYLVQVFFNDSVGNEAHSEEWFSVDTIAPVVTITSPTNTTYTTIVVAIHATNTTDVDKAWYRYKNISWSANYSMTYNPVDTQWEEEELTWIDSSYLVQVFFNDSVGNEAFSEEWFSVDTTPPAVTIISPANSTYTTSEVMVYATNSTSVHTAWYRYKNESWSNNYSMSYNSGVERWEEEGLTWTDGNYQLQIFFNDTVGNEAYSEEWFTVDTTAPAVTISSPNNTTYTATDVVIHATNSTDVDKAWYRFRNGSWSINYSMNYDPSDGRWQKEGLTWTDGNYQLQIFFNDTVGNEAYSEEWFTVDTTAPAVTISSPNNTTYTATDVVIHATNSTDVDKAWYRFRNGSWSVNYSMNYDPSDGRWQKEGLTWTDGNYFIQVFFNDSVGNEAFSEEWFSVDTTAPAVTIISPSNTTYTTSGVDIYASNDSKVHAAWYRYRNNSWSANYSLIYDSDDNRWEVEGLIWTDGNYLIQVFFNDSVGNEAFNEEWFTVDTIAPVVTITSPTNTTYTTTAINIHATNITDVDKAWYRFNNVSWSTNYSMTYDPGDTQWEAEELTWTDGKYLIRVFFNDSVGNEASSEEWFSVDTTPPAVTIISPANSTYTTPDVPIYAINFTPVHTAWYRYKNGSWSANYSMSYDSGEPKWEREGLHWNDGNYLIQVFFNDSVGNEAFSEEWFTVDTTAPVVTITSPTNTTYTTAVVAIHATNTTDVAKAWYRYRNGSWSANYSMSYDLEEPRWEREGLYWIDGNYLIQVFFNDSVGNEASSQEWFTVDTTAPVVTIISPTNTTYTTTIVNIHATNSTDVDRAWYRYQNSTWSANNTIIYDPVDTQWEAEELIWTDGNYLIQVFFNDSVGNKGFSEEWFTIDTTASAVTITSPTNTTYSTPDVPVYAMNSTPVHTAWYRYKNESWSNNYSMSYDSGVERWEAEGLTWMDGNYLIQVFFNDSVGNKAYSDEWFTVDATEPVVTITSPVNTTYTTTTVNIHATNTTDVDKAWYRYQNSTWSANHSMTYDPVDNQWEAEDLTWTDGNYLIQVFFNDSVGNEASSQEWFTVDTTPPAVTIISPVNSTYTTSDVPVYAMNSTLVHTAWYRYKNGSWSTNYSMMYDLINTWWEVEGLTWIDGNYLIQVFFNDSVENEAYNQEWFIVDTTAPAVTIISPTNTTYTSTTITIHATNTTEVDRAWYRFRNGSWSANNTMAYDPVDTQWEAEELTWSDGNYLVQVFFNDSVGNEAYSEEWFSVDTIAPVVTITSPTNTTYTTIVVAIHATNTTNVDKAWYRYNNVSWSANYSMSYDPVNTQWEAEELTWIDGSYLIQVFFNDSVGNEASSQEWFSVDTTPPVVTITSPANTTYTTTTIDIYATNTTSVDKAWYRYRNGSWSANFSMIYDSLDDRWEKIGLTWLDGNYSIQVFFNDSVGNEASSQEWFSVDTIAPVVTITSPTNMTYTTSTVNILATNTTDVDRAWYRFRNGSWSTNHSMIFYLSDNQWEAEEMTWTDGSYLVQAFFNDSVGNEAYNEEWFTVDTMAPAVTIISPANSTYTTPDVAVYTMNSTPVHTAWYRYKNGSWSVNYSMSYDPGKPRWEAVGLTWTDGNYQVQVFFNDTVDNEAYNQEWFTVDTIAPLVTIINPTNTTYTTPEVAVYATNSTSVHTAWYRYKNGSWSANYSMSYDPGEPRWEKEGLHWFDGNYLIQVFFNDSVGNEAFSDEWFTIDTTAPMVTITSPINTTYTSTTISIHATNTTDVDNAWYRFKNGTWSANYSMTYDPAGKQWEVEGLTWSDGNYQVQVLFNDSVGKEAFSEEWFTIDTTAPAVTIISPTNTTYTTTTIDIHATNTTDVDKAWYRYKNGSWSANYSMSFDLGEPRWEAEGIKWSDGSYLVQIFFNDSVGNEAFSEEWFTVDTIAPVVTITSPANTTYTTTVVAIHATNTTDVDKAWYRFNNVSWSTNYSMTYDPGDTQWEADELIWTDGNYLIQVFFNDSVGNEAFSDEWFTVDTTAPAVTIISPINTTYTSTTISIHATNTSDVDKAWYRYKNGSWSNNYSMMYDPIDGQWELEELTWIDGNYPVQVFFNDSVGNEAYSEEWFSVDTIAPAVTITSPTNTTYTTILVAIRATNTTDVDKAWYRYNNVSWSANNTMTYDPDNKQWEAEVLAWIDGSYLVQVFFNDRVGNEAYNEEWFSVDTIAPTVTITSPSNTTYTTVQISIYGINATDVQTAWYRYKKVSWSANYSLTYDPVDTQWEAEDFTWTDGSYLFQVFFNDSVGNEAYSEKWFSVDTTAPDVTIISPTNMTYTTITVNIYTTNNTNTDKAWYRYKNGSWSNNYSMTYDLINMWWEVESLAWTDGNYLLQVFFNDSAGNEGFSERWFTIDTTPPIINIDSPKNQTYSTETINISLSGNADDYWYYIEDIDIENHTWINDIIRVFDNGTYTLHAFGNDSVGIRAHISIIFTVETVIDIVSPIISLETLNNESILAPGTQIVVTISDSNLDTVLFNWNNEDNQTFLPPYHTDLPSVEGYHTLYVYTNDSAGNTASKSFLFIVDGTYPEITLLTPENGSILTSGSEINFNVTEKHLDIVLYNWDFTQNSSLTSPYIVILPEGEGTHSLCIFTNDGVGHWTTSVFTFITDDIEPEIKLLNFQNKSVLLSGTLITLEFNDIHLDTILVNWDGSQNVTCFGCEIALPGDDGEHILYAYSNDTAGNWESALFVFITTDEQETTETSSEQTSTQEKTLSDENEMISEDSNDTQATPVSAVGMLFNILFVSILSIVPITRRLIKRRSPSE